MHKKRINGRDYYYTSIRKNGKVHTIYLGKDPKTARKKEKELKNQLTSRKKGIAALTLGFILLLLILLNLPITGYITSAGTPSVILTLSMRAGEFIPADSQVKILTNNKTITLPLSQALSKSNFPYPKTSGPYYSSLTNLSGSGPGYGIPGTKTLKPTLTVTYLIKPPSFPEGTGKILTANISADSPYFMPFPYENFTVSILSIQGNTSPAQVSLHIQNSTITLTTNYTIQQTGFGAEFLGEKYFFTCETPPSYFNLNPGRYEIIAEILYKNKTLSSLKQNIIIPSPQSSKPLHIETPIFQTPEEFNETLEKTKLSQRLGILISKLQKKSGKFGIELSFPDGSSLRLSGLENLSSLQEIKKIPIPAKYIKTRNSHRAKITTDIISVNPLNINHAQISLKKSGPVNTILYCRNFTNKCNSGWTETSIPFQDLGDFILFNITHFSAYAGAELTIINLQSYPVVGNNWTVAFTTKGIANLTIQAVQGTTWTNTNQTNFDLQFLEIKCGNQTLNYTWTNQTLLIENFSCNETAYETSKVITSGKHTLEFTFGNDTEYAENFAVYTCSSCEECSSYLQNGTMISGDILKLTTDITNYAGANDNTDSGESCIKFGGADNLTFDCQGHTISGDGDEYGYGIWLNDSDSGSNNNTIKNCIIMDFQVGLVVDYSDYNTIINITANSNTRGIYTAHSLSNTFINITTNENGDYGVYALNITSSNFTEIESILNTNYGFILHNSTNNTLTNITVKSTINYDGIIIDTCNFTTIKNAFLENNTDDGLSIVASPSTTENTVINITSISNGGDGIYLFNVWNTNITTANLSSNFRGIYSYDSNLTKLINAYTFYNDYGVYFSYSNYTTIENITTKYNTWDGLWLDIDNSTVKNVVSTNNGYYGVYMVNSYNTTLSNLTIKSNDNFGMRFYRDCDYNTIKDSVIENNSEGGVYLDEYSEYDPEFNVFYNNYFNNSGNYGNILLESDIANPNYFNTSLNCSGQTNIIGGPCIGGNYWTSPSGTGISDICQDLDGYGICDSEYNLTNQTAIAYDYLPLAKIHATRAGYFVKNQTFDVYGRVNITGYYFRTDLNESIADDSSTFSLGTGENVNIGENITLAWNGSAYAKSGTYTSRIFVGDNETVWKSLEIVNSTPENTSISVYYYYSDDLISWTSGNIGQTARFFRYMLVLNTSNTSITPVVYSVTINRTHKSTPGKITITLVNINNPSYTLSKTCSDTAICEKEFLFPAELPGGNYTVSITAENSSAWYENASTSFVRYFEEPVATDVVLIPDPETEVITNMTSDDYSFLINLTVVSETTTLHYPDIQLDDDGLGFKSVENLTSCPSMLSPGESCTKVFNLTVPGGKAPGLYSLIWGAVWINNNGSSGSVQNTSHVDIKSNPGLTVSPTNLTADQNLSQSQIFDFTVQNTGNVVLDNVHVYLASGTIPSSWVSFYSTSTKWNDTTDTWSYLASTEPAPLQINITVTNYTPANYSGIVNITSEYLGSPSAYQLIYLEVNVSPNFTISQTLINITQNLSQTHIQHIQINSTGNSPITNVTVTYISQNLPASWITFNSSSSLWNDTAKSFSQITEFTGETLDVYIKALAFNPGTYTGMLNITTNEGLYRTVNITITIQPILNITDFLYIQLEHGTSGYVYLILNSTGNAKIVNITLNYVNQTLPASWLSFIPSQGNLTEGESKNISIKISVPWHYPPGNYTGYFNITSNNLQPLRTNITVEVPRDASWTLYPTYNQSRAFQLNEKGIVGNLTINNTGNVLINFSITYITAVPNFVTDYNVDGTIMNPTLLNVSAGEEETFYVYHGGSSTGFENKTIKIEITNSTASPSYRESWMLVTVIDNPPEIEDLWTENPVGTKKNYVELYRSIFLNGTARDDSALNHSRIIFNVTKPDGYYSEHLQTYERNEYPYYGEEYTFGYDCLLYTSPSPRD